MDNSEDIEETEIGIVTAPTAHNSQVNPINRFIDIISPSSSYLVLFGGGMTKNHFQEESIDIFENIGDYFTSISIANYIFIQISLLRKIYAHRNDTELLYFHKGAMGYWIPVLFTRLIGVNTCVIKVGAFANERTKENSIKSNVLFVFQSLSFYFSNGAIVFSKSEVDTIPNDNTFIAFSNYRNFNQFDINKDFSDREVDIGFVGGFSEVNGIQNLTIASKNIYKNNTDVKCRFVGDGPLFEEIQSYVENKEFIELPGWVPNDNIEAELNNMKYVFMPSQAEGLPTTAIEAMACGAIIVATPVGSLEDLITDGEVGFILENNSPESISKKYEEIKNCEGVDDIIKNQRECVREKYTLSAGQDSFSRITNELC